jgi:hypothetical protein
LNGFKTFDERSPQAIAEKREENKYRRNKERRNNRKKKLGYRLKREEAKSEERGEK